MQYRLRLKRVRREAQPRRRSQGLRTQKIMAKRKQLEVKIIIHFLEERGTYTTNIIDHTNDYESEEEYDTIEDALTDAIDYFQTFLK